MIQHTFQSLGGTVQRFRETFDTPDPNKFDTGRLSGSAVYPPSV